MQTTGNQPFPELNRSFKGRFPFRLSVPSFVYPAGYAENARRLGPFVDEIELLLFESRPESLPSPSEVRRLALLGSQLDITYNVHLPLDAEVGDLEGKWSGGGSRRMIDVFERIRPVSPTRYILHLAPPTKSFNPDLLHAWQTRMVECIAALLQAAGLEPRQLAVENLDYPPQWYAPVVQSLDLAVCVDVGHILQNGMNLEEIFNLFENRIEMIHLHAAAKGQDHQALDCLTPDDCSLLKPHLQEYRGTVSIEVFSFERLERSLAVLDRMIAPQISQ
jgi:sugar phosphate isomerase/epimerase